jgi:hypothetical protein
MAAQINRSDCIRFVSFECLGNTILKIPVDISKKWQARITREYNQITPHVLENVVKLSTILLTLYFRFVHLKSTSILFLTPKSNTQIDLKWDTYATSLTNLLLIGGGFSK